MYYVDKLIRETDFLNQIKELEKIEEKRIFCRHGLEHLEAVARIAWIINLEEKGPYEKEMLYLAALLHDIGRKEEYLTGTAHEEAGLVVAEELLDQIGYPDTKKKQVVEMIGNHRKTDGNILGLADKRARACYACPVSKECNWKEEAKTKTLEW